MKVTSDNVKTGLMLAGVGIAAYLAFRAYRLGESAKETVTNTVQGAIDTVTGAAEKVGDSVSRITDGRGVADYKKWVSDFWSPDPAISDAEYPEAQPIRAAVSAAESAAITTRYVSPAATFNDYADGRVLGAYFTGLGSDAPILTYPQNASPDSFYALAQEE